ncbi:MAG: VOC family protein, partial [Beijerinckiaceae bacterium]|nr:VOC family protein [Beijerinckiaceae bacterium]
CRHEKPESFWDKGLQDHANGATGVSKVAIVAENPADHAEFLSQFTQVRAFHSSSMGVEFMLGEGQKIEVLTPVAFEYYYGPQEFDASGAPHIAAVELRTSSIAASVEALTHGRVPHEERNGRIIAPSSAAFGVTIAFAP